LSSFRIIKIKIEAEKTNYLINFQLKKEKKSINIMQVTIKNAKILLRPITINLE